ncbi:MAG: hypothetical protein JW724_06780 [Candidatus Altiarchaeota archaeon]|nr:hypothetical protein [Candidatus Altiarchaeota archaeon]
MSEEIHVEIKPADFSLGGLHVASIEKRIVADGEVFMYFMSKDKLHRTFYDHVLRTVVVDESV